VTLGPKTRRLLFLFFLLNHILHCICFKILFTGSKYLVYNWSYTRWIGTVKRVKKSNKKFKNFRVIIIVLNHYFIILKLVRVIKGFILYQIKPTALKSGLQLMENSRTPAELKNCKLENLCLLFLPSSSISGSDIWRVLSSCVTIIYLLWYWPPSICEIWLQSYNSNEIALPSLLSGTCTALGKFHVTLLSQFDASSVFDMADPGIMPSLSIVLQRLETSLGLTAFFLTNFALASLIALSQ